MLATNDTNAVDSLTAFATTMDYLLDNDGFVVAEYNVALSDVADYIADHDAAMADYYLSLGYEPNN